MFIVERDSAGLRIEPHKEMMVIRGCYHGILIFEDAMVPEKNLLGNEGEGLDIALRTFLDISRLQIAVSCLGPAERMLGQGKVIAILYPLYGLRRYFSWFSTLCMSNISPFCSKVIRYLTATRAS